MSALQNRALNRLERRADFTRALVTTRAFLDQAALDHFCRPGMEYILVATAVRPQIVHLDRRL
jgi:hypothetical protein